MKIVGTGGSDAFTAGSNPMLTYMATRYVGS